MVPSRNAKAITKIELVVHTGPGFGRVAVFLGDQRLRNINLAGPTLRKRVLVKVKYFEQPVSGTVRIVTLGTKPVRIDGLGLFTKPLL